MTNITGRAGAPAIFGACMLCVAAGTAAATMTAAPAAPGQDGSLERAVALVDAGRHAEARVLLVPLARAHPRDDRVAACLGRAFFGLEQYGEAITWFEKAVALVPQSSDHHVWLGHAALEEVQRASILRKLPLASKARKALERAVELDPANVEARGFLFAFYRQAPGVAGGSKERARQQADAMVGLDPLRGYLARASLNDEEGHLQAAERDYLAAIAANPGRVASYVSLGQMHVRAGSHDKAFAIFERGLAAVPGNLPLLYQVGRTAAMSGQRLDDGERALQDYLEGTTDPQWRSAAYWRLGMLHEHRRRHADARAAYEQALRIDPNRKEAREALRRLPR